MRILKTVANETGALLVTYLACFISLLLVYKISGVYGIGRFPEMSKLIPQAFGIAIGTRLWMSMLLRKRD
jgi:hypothetical protein